MNSLFKTLTVTTVGMTLAGATTMVQPAQALTFFSNSDPGAGPDAARPNSNAAAASFDAAAAALGTLNTINFEAQTLGLDLNRTLAPGVTATWFNQSGLTVDEFPSVITGYNTTASGSKFAQVTPINTGIPNGVTFSFATPIQSWGAFFTGVGTSGGNVILSFNNGTSQIQNVLGSPNGGVSFLGFTDSGRSIASITIQRNQGGNDIFGIDDMRYVAIPTPALLPGLIGMGIAAIRRRKVAAATLESDA